MTTKSTGGTPDSLIYNTAESDVIAEEIPGGKTTRRDSLLDVPPFFYQSHHRPSVDSAGFYQAGWGPKHRRSRTDSLAYTECPNLHLNLAAYNQRANLLFSNWKLRNSTKNGDFPHTLATPLNSKGHHTYDIKAGRRQVNAAVMFLYYDFR